MPTTYYFNRHGGHCRDHVRETFSAALDAYETWEDGKPEPTVEFEVNYVPREVLISKACGLVWNCSDILPSLEWSVVENTDLIDLVGRRTYGSAARAMYARIKEHDA